MKLFNSVCTSIFPRARCLPAHPTLTKRLFAEGVNELLPHRLIQRPVFCVADAAEQGGSLTETRV